MDFLTWIGAPGTHQNRGSLAAVNQWAQANGKTEAPGRGEENVKLLDEMFNRFYQRYAKVPRDAYLNLGGGCAASEVALARAIHDCANFQSFGAANTDFFKEEFRRAVKMLYGFALNLSNWAYPACCYYYTAKTSETQEGASKDFTTKHLASTADEKSSVQAARIRATPVPARNVAAYGNILTSHSGAIKRDGATDTFRAEIKARQQEFTDTHALLCQYFAEQFLDLQMPPRGQFSLIDGVTFVTLHPLDMFEFYTPGGGTPQRKEGTYYVHYSISAKADGKAWAAHHLARTDDTARQFMPAGRTQLTAVIQNTQGFAAVDPASYMDALD